jgi:hypothetical protein
MDVTQDSQQARAVTKDSRNRARNMGRCESEQGLLPLPLADHQSQEGRFLIAPRRGAVGGRAMIFAKLKEKRPLRLRVPPRLDLQAALFAELPPAVSTAIDDG